MRSWLVYVGFGQFNKEWRVVWVERKLVLRFLKIVE